MGMALFLIARLAARLIHPGAAWFVVFVCLSMRGINDQAADARPYALGTCIAAASLWFLIRWLDSARWWDAALFIVLAALLWRVHLLFWPFYIVLAVYALARLAASRDARGLAFDAGRICRARCCPGPGADRRAESLSPRHLACHRRAPHAARPAHLAQIRSHPDLRRGRFRSEPIVPLAARVGISRLNSSLVLIAAWWLLQPVALFAVSRVTGSSMFVARYLYLGLPGAALAATLAAAYFIPPDLLEAAIPGLRRRRAGHVGPMARALGRCITARIGGWRPTPSISGPGTIPTPPCFAPARSSKPARRYGSRPMRSPVFSTAICRFILFAASPTCCRLKIRPKPSAMSKAWPMARSPRLAASLFTEARAAFDTGATGSPSSPSFPTWHRERLGPFGDVVVELFEKPHQPAPPHRLDPPYNIGSC